MFILMIQIQNNYINVTCDVPQCSILVLISVIKYIKDMHTVSSLMKCTLLADYTNVLYTGKVNEASSNIDIQNDDGDVFLDSNLWQTNLITISAITQRNWFINSILMTYRDDRVHDYYKEKGVERNC